MHICVFYYFLIYYLFQDCGEPPAPTNGLVELTVQNETTVGATANQSCHEGYDLIGNDVIECGENGTWSALAFCVNSGLLKCKIMNNV